MLMTGSSDEQCSTGEIKRLEIYVLAARAGAMELLYALNSQWIARQRLEGANKTQELALRSDPATLPAIPHAISAAARPDGHFES